MKVKSLSCVQLFATPWTAAYQAPPSMDFSRQEYWSGLPLPSPNLEDGSMIKTQARDVEHLQAEEGRGRVSLGDLQKTPSAHSGTTSIRVEDATEMQVFFRSQSFRVLICTVSGWARGFLMFLSAPIFCINPPRL